MIRRPNEVKIRAAPRTSSWSRARFELTLRARSIAAPRIRAEKPFA
jgi:hypothetical protein